MSTYSQYSYYQQQQSTLATAPFTAHQVSGATWNGLRWVTGPASSYSYANTSNTSTGAITAAAVVQTQQQAQPSAHAPPPTPPAPPGLQDTTNNDDSASLVTKYSQYYQSWTAKVTEQRQKAENLPPGNQKEEATRMAQWAEYYADQSSRAAHYHNELQHNSYREASPPGLDQNFQSHNTTPSHHQWNDVKQALVKQNKPDISVKKSRWSQPSLKSAASYPSPGCNDLTQSCVTNEPFAEVPQPSGPPPLGGPPPEGLKRYVHRCLARCKTEHQRAAIQQEVERVISEQIRNESMHNTNWDKMQLIAVPGLCASGQPLAGSCDNEQNCLYPVSSLSSPSDLLHPPKRTKIAPLQNNNNGRTGDIYDFNLPANDSYYGRSNESDGKQSHIKSVGIGEVQHSTVAQSNSFNRKESSNSDFVRGNENQKLPEKNSYYGRTGGNGSVCSDDRSSSSRSFGSDQDFVSFSGFSKQGKKNKRLQKQQNQKKKQANYKHFSSSNSGKNGRDGFERSSMALAQRASRFAGKGGIVDAVTSSTNADADVNLERYMGKTVIGGTRKKLDELDYEHMTVKGTCTNLEKDYLRLTSPPKAELVRPKPVLISHLFNLKKLWGKSEEERGGTANSKRDYLWFCSQLKAMRQDLTVQRIFDSFSVEVYEMHARIALEKGDLNEYNQCQTQLKELYENLLSFPKSQIANTDGKKTRTGLENQNEFIAYRIIYYVYLTGNKKYDGGSSDLFKIMLSLTSEQRKDPFISHALRGKSKQNVFFSLQILNNANFSSQMQYNIIQSGLL